MAVAVAEIPGELNQSSDEDEDLVEDDIIEEAAAAAAVAVGAGRLDCCSPNRCRVASVDEEVVEAVVDAAPVAAEL